MTELSFERRMNERRSWERRGFERRLKIQPFAPEAERRCDERRDGDRRECADRRGLWV